MTNVWCIGIPEVPTIVAIFDMMADSVKHLLWGVSIPCIQDLGGGRGVWRGSNEGGKEVRVGRSGDAHDVDYPASHCTVCMHSQ